MVFVSLHVAGLAEPQTLSPVRTIIAEVSVTSTNAFTLSFGFVEAPQATKILIIVAICHFRSVPFVLAIRAGIHSIVNDNAIIILAAIWAPVDTPTPSHCEIMSHNRYYVFLGPFPPIAWGSLALRGDRKGTHTIRGGRKGPPHD